MRKVILICGKTGNVIGTYFKEIETPEKIEEKIRNLESQIKLLQDKLSQNAIQPQKS